MGMDLKPLNPTSDAPREPNGHPTWGRYNIAGWTWIWMHLETWGVDTHEFSGFNDGHIISAETCAKVADTIEAHLDELNNNDRRWLMPHIKLWRTCGGYAQY